MRFLQKVVPKLFVFVFVLHWAQSAKILGVFIVPLLSHQSVYQPIWKELSLRGHEVTVITTMPLNDPNLVNLTEIKLIGQNEMVTDKYVSEIKTSGWYSFQEFKDLFVFGKLMTEDFLNNTGFKRILNDPNQEFDLILVEGFYHTFFTLSYRFNAPIIVITSLGIPVIVYDAIGNPSHPVIYPDLNSNLHNTPPSLLQKFQSVFYTTWCRYYYNFIVMPQAEELARKYFGDDIPPLGDSERNISLMFLNTNPLIYPPRPNVPAIIELGQMHLKPLKPLPDDLQEFLDEAKEGVVYFSLGSNVKSVNTPMDLQKTIMNALGQLPYKVLWKWEANHLKAMPRNVYIREWVPQQDLLAHKNIKVFVTQGGLQSFEESVFNGVPMVVLPFIGDQNFNAQRIQEQGMGLKVEPNRLTAAILKNAILEVALNQKYRNKVMELRDVSNDQPMTGLERAVWWSEYVIRHKGAKYLRSPMADISWFHYLLLDVAFAMLALVVIIIYLSFVLIRYIKRFRLDKLKRS